MKKPVLHIAIPAKDELDYLFHTLQAVSMQTTDFQFYVYVCVNQPEAWWQDPEKVTICHHNQQMIKQLQDGEEFRVTLLDYSSPGRGWVGKRHGVGWARKVLFDHILSIADEDDILISLDADTLFSENYLQSIGDNFSQLPDMETLSIPYYHKLTKDDRTNRAILRYELYMRSWFLNMHRISSPYTFTAIGSAIALRIRALRKIGGITPMKSGEDFYLLQKLRKMSLVHNHNSEVVYPAARFSDRVYFGTGPAMIKGATGDWKSYAIYHHSLFDDIADTYQIIPQLFRENIETPFTAFLAEQFRDDDFLTPLRQNAKEFSRFERAFHEKADGLRILQYIKQKHEKSNFTDEQGLCDNFTFFFPKKTPDYLLQPFVLQELSTEQLVEVREMLFESEKEKRH
ncbi:MAG: hypothetical protein LBV02_04980 [Bacteroidales bacterium]|jgi:hypothetical protein|nr:hypothetical protein [Bacteroidales bacterium]